MNAIFLLVDDDPNDVLLVKEAFGPKIRPQLKVVSSGDEAIDYLTGKQSFGDRRQFPLPEVILLDLNMPGISGFDFLHWLRKESPGDQHLIPVVVMSSSAEPKDIRRAYELGGNSYVLKAIDWLQFRERMNAVAAYWTDHVQKPQTDS